MNMPSVRCWRLHAQAQRRPAAVSRGQQAAAKTSGGLRRGRPAVAPGPRAPPRCISIPSRILPTPGEKLQARRVTLTHGTGLAAPASPALHSRLAVAPAAPMLRPSGAYAFQSRDEKMASGSRTQCQWSSRCYSGTVCR